MFPTDDIIVMNRHVFRSIIENMKWNYRVNGFVGAAASLF